MAESPAGECQHDPNKLEQYNIHKLHGKLKAIKRSWINRINLTI